MQGEIQCCSYASIPGLFRCELGEQSVKNIRQPVRAYRVTQESQVTATESNTQSGPTRRWHWGAVAAVVVLLIGAVWRGVCSSILPRSRLQTWRKKVQERLCIPRRYRAGCTSTHGSLTRLWPTFNRWWRQAPSVRLAIGVSRFRISTWATTRRLSPRCRRRLT